VRPGWPRLAKAIVVGCFFAIILAVLVLSRMLGIPGGWTYIKLWAPLLGLAYWPLAWQILRRRYGERRFEQEQVNRRRSEMTMMRVVFVYLLPVFALGFVVLALIDIGPSWRAAHGGGRVGTLRLDSRSCRSHTCTWQGQFRSDDGTILRPDVLMHDGVARSARVGDEIRARDTGDRTGVFALTGSTGWMDNAAILGVSIGYLIGWALWLIRPIRWPRRRRRRGPVELPGLQ
jgi:hypothetical protein